MGFTFPSLEFAHLWSLPLVSLRLLLKLPLFLAVLPRSRPEPVTRTHENPRYQALSPERGAPQARVARQNPTEPV